MKYKAFISYNQKDSDFTKKLHQALLQLVSELNPSAPDLIFRDRVCMEANAEIDRKLYHALEESEWLIVVCSPHVQAAQGEKNYVDLECDYFARRLNREEHILCVIADNTPQQRDVGAFYPPSIAGRSHKLASDARNDEWSACIARIVARMYGKDFETYYDYCQRLTQEKSYLSLLGEAGLYLSKKAYKGAEALLSSYQLSAPYADIQEMEWNYVLSVASRYAFTDYLGKTAVPAEIKKTNLVFDPDSRRLYYGNAQGILFTTSLAPDAVSDAFSLAPHAIEGLVLLSSGQLACLTQQAAVICRLTGAGLERVATFPLENTYYASQKKVFNDFYAPPSLLFATDLPKRTLAVLTHASVTWICLETGRRVVAPIPDRAPWELKAAPDWKHLELRGSYRFLAGPRRMVGWEAEGKLLFDYQRGSSLPPVAVWEVKEGRLWADGEAVFQFPQGEEEFSLLFCAEETDKIVLTESLYLRREQEVYTLWRCKKEIPLESARSIRYLERAGGLLVHRHNYLVKYDPEGNRLGQLPIGVASDWLSRPAYDVDETGNYCAYVKANGEEVEVMETAGGCDSHPEGRVAARLVLFHREETNLLKRMLQKVEKESLVASALHFLPDGNLLIGCKNGAVLFWQKGPTFEKVAEHLDAVVLLLYSPQGGYLVSASAQEVFWYTYEAGKAPVERGFYYHPSRLVSLVFTAEDRVAGLSENGELWEWDLQKSVVFCRIATGVDRMYDFCLSPDKSIFIGVSLHRFEQEECRLSFWSVKKKRIVYTHYFPERIVKLFFTSTNYLVLVFENRLVSYRIWEGAPPCLADMQAGIRERRKKYAKGESSPANGA